MNSANHESSWCVADWMKRHDVKVCMHTQGCYRGVKRYKQQGRCVFSTAFFTVSVRFPHPNPWAPPRPSPAWTILPSKLHWVINSTFLYLNSKINLLSVILETTHLRVQNNNTSIRFFQINSMSFNLVGPYNSAAWLKLGKGHCHG